MHVKTGRCAFTLGKKKRFSSADPSTSYKVPTDISTMFEKDHKGNCTADLELMH